MTFGALSVTALFLAGAIYVALKLREDWLGRRRGHLALGLAALAGYIIMLGFAAHAVVALTAVP